MGDTTTCVYQFIYNEKFKNDTQITKYFIIHRLVLCIKVYSYVDHMFYAWSSSHNTEVPIAKEKNKYLFSLNTNTTLFSWEAVNSSKNGMKLVYTLI